MWRLVCLAVFAGTTVSVDAQGIAAGERKHGLCATCHGITNHAMVKGSTHRASRDSITITW